MPGLVHDAALRRPSNSRARGMPSAKRMTGIFGGIKPRPLCQFLHNPRYIGGSQTTREDSTVPIYWAEHRALGNCHRFKPGLNRPHRAGVRIGPVGYADLSAHALLIGFAAPKIDRQSVSGEGQIGGIQADQLRAPKRPREAQQYEGTIPQSDQPSIGCADHCSDCHR